MPIIGGTPEDRPRAACLGGVRGAAGSGLFLEFAMDHFYGVFEQLSHLFVKESFESLTRIVITG